MSKCRKCRERESTGIIFDMCEPCFTEFEQKIKDGAGPDGKYKLPDQELEYLHDPFVTRKN